MPTDRWNEDAQNLRPTNEEQCRGVMRYLDDIETRYQDCAVDSGS